MALDNVVFCIRYLLSISKSAAQIRTVLTMQVLFFKLPKKPNDVTTINTMPIITHIIDGVKNRLLLALS